MADVIDAEAKFRAKLAISIVLVGMFGMFAVSGFAVWLVGADDRDEMMRLVFASILPLLGTWVGTVLAFYFARESLQAATDSTARLTGRFNPETPVAQVMIPRDRIVARAVNAEADAQRIPLAELMSLMKSRDFHRIPVFDASGAVLYVVHDSTINAYAASLTGPGATPPPAGPTLAALAAIPAFDKLIKAIAVVGLSATVADARLAMASVEGSNDVFVTQDGRRKDRVEGWLTNTDLASWR